MIVKKFEIKLGKYLKRNAELCSGNYNFYKQINRYVRKFAHYTKEWAALSSLG